MACRNFSRVSRLEAIVAGTEAIFEAGLDALSQLPHARSVPRSALTPSTTEGRDVVIKGCASSPF